MERLQAWLIGLCVLVFALAGCSGPSKGEVLGLELLSAGIGMVLGQFFVWIGYAFGSRGEARSWFVCSQCLTPQPARVRDGELQVCTQCGQQSTANYPDGQSFEEMVPRTRRGYFIGRL